MVWLEILVLAVIQGVGEFLPISSSGHLIVVEDIFGYFGSHVHDVLLVNILLHGGTLLSILLFYHRRLLRIVTTEWRLVGLVAVGTLPAVFAGLVLKRYLSEGLEHPVTAGIMFPVTGVLLLWAARHQSGSIAAADLSYRKALVIGLSQAAAILPGLSRSGTTIAAGLRCGLRRDEAATFSFLLAIPAIAGAMVLGVYDLWVAQTSGSGNDAILSGGSGLWPLGVGVVVSFVVGLVSLWWLIRWLKEGRLAWFAWWVIPLGPAVIAWYYLR